MPSALTATDCPACGITPSQGLRACASCGAMACALCTVYRVSVDPDATIWRHWCKPCDPKAKPPPALGREALSLRSASPAIDTIRP